jgi:hypothetical protein
LPREDVVVSKVLIMVALATGAVAAQSVTTKMGGQGSVLGTGDAASGAELSPLDQFVLKLKLDEEKQIPTAERVFGAAKSAAAPYGQQLTQQRRRLLDAELAGKADDAKLALETYTEAARMITGVEATFMARVFLDLKPDQKKKVSEAFVFLTGVFQPTAGGAQGRRKGGDR